MSADIADGLKEDLAWTSYILLRNTNAIAAVRHIDYHYVNIIFCSSLGSIRCYHLFSQSTKHFFSALMFLVIYLILSSNSNVFSSFWFKEKYVQGATGTKSMIHQKKFFLDSLETKLKMLASTIWRRPYIFHKMQVSNCMKFCFFSLERYLTSSWKLCCIFIELNECTPY